MEKRIWTAPRAEVEQFEMTQYIAACHDINLVYKFRCNAGVRFADYNVYLADGTPYATSGRDSGGCKTDYTGYSPCGDTHEADTDDIYLPGYMYRQGTFGGNTGEKIDVIIWTDNYTNVHCTADLVKDSWETAKS